MKKLLSAILMAGILVCVFVIPARAAGVSTSARAWALYCADNGEILCADNADERLPMASTTKIMTALLTLEEAQEENRVVTFTEEMTAEGSSMYLKVGEKVTLYDLAVGMMMQSGNDAANAAALAVGGSYEGFADMMNAKAEELGMRDTHFVTPSGLDDPEHYTTAHDMAVLMAYALRNPLFSEITSQTSMTVDFTSPSDKRVTYPNHNRLLSMYADCIGGKTGYTGTAGRCLVTAARRDGLTLVAVTLDDRDDWDDHMALYDYGFAHYRAVAADDSLSYTVPVVGGIYDSTAVYPDSSGTVVIPADRADDVAVQVTLPPFLYAPVSHKQVVGTLRYTLGDETLYETSLIAADNIAYNDRRRGLIEYIKDILHWHS